MIFEQHRAPFSSEPISFGNKNNKTIRYFRIGIENPHSIPLSEMDLDHSSIDANYLIFQIEYGTGAEKTTDSYLITENDVLEFSNLNITNFALSFISDSEKRYNYIHKYNPYLIVNIAYEEAN